MKTITDNLVTIARGELVKQREVSDNEGKYAMFNDGGVECETGEFLHGLVRIIKPKWVLETGTHRGVGMAYICSALKANGQGRLETFEIIPEHHAYTMDLAVRMKLAGFVTCYLRESLTYKPTVKYDLMLLDTEPQIRFEELLHFYNSLAPGGFVFIHDLHRHMGQQPNEEHGFGWPFGELPEAIKELVKQGGLRPFHFPTPRGLAGFYKPTTEDFKWS